MPNKIVTTEYDLERVPAPNLPFAPVQYDSRYHEAFNNVLRLYFNRLDNFLAKLAANIFGFGSFRQNAITELTANVGNGTTTPISVTSTEGFPASGYILIKDEIIGYTTKTSTQLDGTVTRGLFGTSSSAHSSGLSVTDVQATGSPTAVGTVFFNATDFSNGVYVDANPEEIYFDNAGVYNIQFSAQFLNFTNTEDNVSMWFAKNGTDIANSASIVQINSKHGGNPGAAILTVNIFEEFDVGDYLTLDWASVTGNTVLASYPASSSPLRPVVPAVILTVNYVSTPTA